MIYYSIILFDNCYFQHILKNFKKNKPNNVIANNNRGIFNDISAGNYKIKMIVPAAGQCSNNDIKDNINITILGDAIGQVINRKIITTCEINGVSTNSGKVLIDVSESAPFAYKIIKTSFVGTGTSEIWTLSSSNNTNNNFNWALPQGTVPSNTQHTLRSTDKCNNKITSQASLQPINPPAIIAGTQSPCNNVIDYTFGINPYATGFTYRWVKIPDVNTTLSTASNITLSGNYSAAYYGIYRCYVSLGRSIDRYLDVNIYSQQCGSALSVNLISFTGNKQIENVILEWITDNQINFSHFEIERSMDAINFVKIQTVNANNTSTTVKYNGIDNVNTITTNRIFYRLKSLTKMVSLLTATS